MGTPDPRNSIRCSACTALGSAGATFCPSCGDPLAKAAGTEQTRKCPACPGSQMEGFRLQPTPAHPQGWAVFGCRGCGGVWVDLETLDAMLASAAQQGSGDGRAMSVKRRNLSLSGKVVYRKCSVCDQTMIRRNFAQISGVIVDQCRLHGTFFDAGELEDVLAFVRSGGMVLARRRQNESLDRERRRAEMRQAASHRSPLMTEVEPMTGLPIDGFSHQPDLGLAFVRWAGRWVRTMFK